MSDLCTFENRLSLRMLVPFQGHDHCFEAVVNMPPPFVDLQDFVEALPRKLAEQNQVDPYSYLFEMMETADIEVTGAEGFISQWLDDAPLSLPVLIEKCRDTTREALLEHLLLKHTDSPDQELMAALREAYEAGRIVGRHQN